MHRPACTIRSMLVAIDIGNTNVVWGIFEGSSLLAHWRLATNPKATVDEYGVLCLNLLTRTGRSPEQVTGAISNLPFAVRPKTIAIVTTAGAPVGWASGDRFARKARITV